MAPLARYCPLLSLNSNIKKTYLSLFSVKEKQKIIIIKRSPSIKKGGIKSSAWNFSSFLGCFDPLFNWSF
jgi:hypothetical protein